MFEIEDEALITAGYDPSTDWREEFKLTSATDTSRDEEIARRLAAAELNPYREKIQQSDPAPDLSRATAAYTSARDTGFEKMYREEKARNAAASASRNAAASASRPAVEYRQRPAVEYHYQQRPLVEYYNYIPDYYDMYTTTRLKDQIRSIINMGTAEADLEARVKRLVESAAKKPTRSPAKKSTSRSAAKKKPSRSPRRSKAAKSKSKSKSKKSRARRG